MASEWTMNKGQSIVIGNENCDLFIVHCVLCGEEIFFGSTGDPIGIYSNGAEQYYGCSPCCDAMNRARIAIGENAVRHDRTA